MPPLNIKKLLLLFSLFFLVPGLIWFTVVNFVESAITGFKNLHYIGPCYSYDGSKPPPEIPPFQWKDTGLITIWFDDAWHSQFTNAAPLMHKMHFNGALAVAIRFVCKPSFMTWNNIYKLQSDGWEISSHSLNHVCDITYYTESAIQKELVLSKKIFKEHGLRVNQFVMPCGYSPFNLKQYFLQVRPRFLEGVKRYYTAYRSTASNKINPLPVSDPYDLRAFEVYNTTSLSEVYELIQQAVNQKSWLILVFHQVGEDDSRIFNSSIKQFKEILELIKASGLPVVLPTQALSIKEQ